MRAFAGQWDAITLSVAAHRRELGETLQRALRTALPAREAQPGLVEGTLALFELLAIEDDENRWLEGYVRWELGLLQAAGFRLDLASCAVSGVTDRLAHVSPKSGRAVAEGEAGEFAGRMLALPRFLGGVALSLIHI